MVPRRPPNDSDDVAARERVENADETSITNAVVDVIARVREEDPREVEFRLFDYLDPDVLARMANQSGVTARPRWKLEFSLEDLTVTIRRDEHLSVTAR